MLKIQAANSARTFNKPARLLREAWDQRLLRRGDTALEIGAGCLRNARWLLDRGARVDVLEEADVVRKYSARYADFQKKGGQVFAGTWPSRRYHAVVCTFVLGVITPRLARLRLLEKIRDRMRPKGVVLLSARGMGDVKTKTRKGRRWRDGFITPIGTFVKPFRRSELLRMAESVGLVPCGEVRPFRSNSGIIDLILVKRR